MTPRQVGDLSIAQNLYTIQYSMLCLWLFIANRTRPGKLTVHFETLEPCLYREDNLT